jgi:single-strand DNA-binding protein
MTWNHVVVVGVIADPPEQRSTNRGTTMASFRVASDYRVPDLRGARGETPMIFEVSCFEEVAVNVCESLRRGDRIIVTGRLDQHLYGSGDDRHTKVVIIATDVAASLRKTTVEVRREPKPVPLKPIRLGVVGIESARRNGRADDREHRLAIVAPEPEAG